MKGHDIPHYHFMSYIVDDEKLAEKLRTDMSGKIFKDPVHGHTHIKYDRINILTVTPCEDWWDTSEAAGPKQRPGGSWDEEVPQLDALAIEGKTVKFHGYIIMFCFCMCFLPKLIVVSTCL